MNKRSKRNSVVSRHTKRFLRRMADRENISYEKAVVKFYGRPIKSLDKQLAICLGVYIGESEVETKSTDIADLGGFVISCRIR